MLQQLSVRCDEIQESAAKTKKQLETLQNTIEESDHEKDPLKVSEHDFHIPFCYTYTANPNEAIPVFEKLSVTCQRYLAVCYPDLQILYCVILNKFIEKCVAS